MKYTVLLLYPDYLSDDSETFLAWVVAKDPVKAVDLAQLRAAEDNEIVFEDRGDFKVLLVVEGHHNDVKPN